MIAAAELPTTCLQVLEIAHRDAMKAYRSDLSDCRIEICLQDDGWHVNYSITDPEVNGGAPNYIVDPTSGAVIWKTYQQ